MLSPSRILLVLVAAFQVLLAYATWQIHGGFPLDVSWLGRGPLRGVADVLVPLFPFAASAARIAAPLVLLMVHWSRMRKLLGVAISPTSEWTMRVALALTFAAHGLESLQRRGSFLDMLIVAARNLLDMNLSESSAQWMLLGIGILDLAAAVLVLATRRRAVAGYMAVWGFITASARLVTLDPSLGWFEFALCASHWRFPWCWCSPGVSPDQCLR